MKHIDKKIHSDQSRPMMQGCVHLRELKTLLSIVFAMALALFPPSALHASSAHGEHHVPVSIAVDHDNGHGSVSPGAIENAELVPANDPSGENEDDLSQSCCNGICMPFDLTDEQSLAFGKQGRESHLALHGQSESIETTGFLRPPKHLI